MTSIRRIHVSGSSMMIDRDGAEKRYGFMNDMVTVPVSNISAEAVDHFLTFVSSFVSLIASGCWRYVVSEYVVAFYCTELFRNRFIPFDPTMEKR
jgi:hypothetical protein